MFHRLRCWYWFWCHPLHRFVHLLTQSHQPISFNENIPSSIPRYKPSLRLLTRRIDWIHKMKLRLMTMIAVLKNHSNFFPLCFSNHPQILCAISNVKLPTFFTWHTQLAQCLKFFFLPPFAPPTNSLTITNYCMVGNFVVRLFLIQVAQF